MFSGIYKNRRVLVTGHTGFKGSWLCAWLKKLGAEVTGVSLSPEDPNHWDLLNLEMSDHRSDIRDFNSLQSIVGKVQPEIVFHLAAQSLVRKSYKDPLETWSTNVMGTANLLEVCRLTESVKAIVVITTDKCYENKEWEWGYREIDALGGYDPYSASKAGAELVVNSYRQSWFSRETSPLLCSARAGNVIGGGDWSEDRLIPDLVRAVDSGKNLEIRSPAATRPWQHVLEPLSGYLLLGQRLLEGDNEFAEPWNFGPDKEGNRTVKQVLEEMKMNWPEIGWDTSNENHPHEAKFLYLDISKATSKLGWKPVLSFEESIKMTADWYENYSKTNDIVTMNQLDTYIELAKTKNISWSQD